MKIDKVLISKLEKLSRLELSEAERTSIGNDLNNILSMVEKLNELDTQGVEPLMHISEAANDWRADEIKHQISRTAALQIAPHSDGQYFLVPKVIE